MYVDDFLEDRSSDPGYPPEASRLLMLLVTTYRKAMNTRKWATATAVGDLMICVAEDFHGHPAHPGTFEKP